MIYCIILINNVFLYAFDYIYVVYIYYINLHWYCSRCICPFSWKWWIPQNLGILGILNVFQCSRKTAFWGSVSESESGLNKSNTNKKRCHMGLKIIKIPVVSFVCNRFVSRTFNPESFFTPGFTRKWSVAARGWGFVLQGPCDAWMKPGGFFLGVGLIQLTASWWFGILGMPRSNNPFHEGILGIQTTTKTSN